MVRPGSVDGGNGSMDRSPLQMHLLKDHRILSALATPKRHTFGAERTDLTTIMAKLNALGGQVLAHDTMFENQRIQADEIQSQLSEQQDQLKVIQHQLEIQHKLQERILDILQNIVPNWTGPANLAQVDLPTTTYPIPPKDTFAKELSVQVEAPQDPSIKTKRPRGRPRMKCSRCREKRPLLEDTSLCEACVGLPIRPPKKRNLSLKRDALTIGNLSKQPRLDLHQDTKPRTADSSVHDSNEHDETFIVAHSQEVQRRLDMLDIPFRSSRSEDINQNEVQDEIIVVSQPSETRLNPDRNTKTPVGKDRSSQSTVIAASSASYNGPFFEGSRNRDTPLEDIVDQPLLDGISESGTTSSTHTTSVAESISIDDLMDVVKEDKIPRTNSITQGRLSSQQLHGRETNQYNQAHNALASRLTEHTVRANDTTHASTPTITVRAPQANMLALLRKQEQNTGPDGSKHDSHYKLVQRVTGNIWKTANRRY